MRPFDLIKDCTRCAALCCVATSFEVSEDFAFAKPAGGCQYLTAACRCAIHHELAQRGLLGCAVYDCHGAGQRVTRAFAGSADHAARDEVFLMIRVVHELLWLLGEAAKLCPPRHPLQAELARSIAGLDAVPCDRDVRELDLRPLERDARAILRRVGDVLRARGGRSLVVLGGRSP
jgi:hypothetical protein